MNLTDEQKKNRKDFAEINKKYDKKHGKDRIKYHNAGEPDFSYRTFVLFDGTEVSEGGWYSGRKWMTAKFLKAAESRWVSNSYKTGEEQPDYDTKNQWIPHQCGGCRWFAAFDLDYGVCCNEVSPNDGHITFEHGGCIKHSDFDSPYNQH